jgi:hypothetical protein
MEDDLPACPYTMGTIEERLVINPAGKANNTKPNPASLKCN